MVLESLEISSDSKNTGVASQREPHKHFNSNSSFIQHVGQLPIEQVVNGLSNFFCIFLMVSVVGEMMSFV